MLVGASDLVATSALPLLAAPVDLGPVVQTDSLFPLIFCFICDRCGCFRSVDDQDIARLTRGAYCRFDPGAARQLAELLRAVAVFAAGGMPALAARHDPGAIKLLGQMGS